MRKIVLLFIVFFRTIVVFGQDGPDSSFNYDQELEKSVKAPVSPEAEAFKIFGDVPVNTYTGQMNYSVPLDVYNGYEMSLPVSLSYNPGIKVSQLATGAGLGWNLNVGGRITRIVNGLPDNGVPQSIFDSTARNKLLKYYAIGNNFETIDDAWDNYYFLRDIRDNKVDVFPDYYQLNVMGITETIVFDVVGDMQPKVISNPRMKVSAVTPSNGRGDISSWTVTAENGCMYFFAKTEKTYREADDRVDNSPAQNYNNSWVLTKVVSPNQLDSFDFIYQAQSYSSEISTVAEYQTASTTLKQFQTNYGVDNLSSYIPDIRITQQFLKKIIHNDKLIYDIDLQTRYDHWQKNTGNSTFSRVKNKIDGIQMYRFNEISKINELWRSVELSHTYFGPVNYANNPTVVSRSNHKKIRLKLDRIDFKSPDGEIVNAYNFEYDSPDKLPSRTSYARDYLGYYNGASNSVLYPRVDLPGISMGGAYREANPLVSSFGSLKKVIYPTGGASEFKYENHIISKSQSLEPEIIGSLSANGGFSDFPCNGLCLDKYVESPIVKSKMVYVPDGFYTMKLKKTGSDQGNGTSTGFEVWAIKRGNNQEQYDGFLGGGTPLNSSFYWSRAYGNEFSETKHLAAGYYQLTVANSITGTNVSIQIINENFNQTEIVQEPVPGLRLQSIKNYDHTGDVLSVKEYRYTKEINSVLSSAKQLYRPSLIDFVTAKRFNGSTGTITDTDRVVRRSGAAQSPQGHVVYEKVFEIQKSATGDTSMADCPNNPDGGPILVEEGQEQGSNPFIAVDISNGYVETNYNVGVNGIVPESYAPFSNNYVSDYKMGKPKSVKIFNMCNKLLQKTEYTYDSAAVFSSPGISVNNNENNRYNYLMYLQSENGSVYTGLVEGRLSCLGNGCEDRVIYEYAGVPFICLSENAIGRPSNLIECNGEKTAAMMQARGKSVNGRIGFMSSETQVRYFDTDSIKSHTYYTYNEHSKYLLKERKVQLQGDQTTKEVFYYPRDLTTNNFPDADIFNTEETNALEGLLDQNKHVVPIRVDVFNGQQLLSSKITSYQSVGNTFYPKTIKLAKGTNPYEARMEFLEYSSKGKPTKISIENEKLFLYTYGYNGRYLTEAIQGVPMDMADSVTPSTSILDVYPEAHITSYTYNLLGKPTEIEDPRGLKIQYIYDKFYRLTKVKDQSGNILSENQYNYINN